MGIALLSLAELASPLQSLLARLASPRRRSPLRYVTVHPACGSRKSPGARPPAPRATALRVVRMADSGAPRGARVVISGRMADVCAELDRLAALEARHTAPSRH